MACSENATIHFLHDSVQLYNIRFGFKLIICGSLILSIIYFCLKAKTGANIKQFVIPIVNRNTLYLTKKNGFFFFFLVTLHIY